eukprot:CAMPEP_0202458396 /NCGR_PEP_ID=MMETSP1360-20130828/24562_1 /ASSEMBLY_ACC=CAM_ASM_000848 /TAXON_ID=515479 /ORGANISM="Licmophora paradoxa, Strain CCMP2313" /LENGTH=105 /DNA_ID=CAMNT_0049078909 /DNA_START=27 /DNA_END=344 /DNA_ORIENTATION=+
MEKNTQISGTKDTSNPHVSFSGRLETPEHIYSSLGLSSTSMQFFSERGMLPDHVSYVETTDDMMERMARENHDRQYFLPAGLVKGSLTTTGRPTRRWMVMGRNQG